MQLMTAPRATTSLRPSATCKPCFPVRQISMDASDPGVLIPRNIVIGDYDGRDNGA